MENQLIQNRLSLDELKAKVAALPDIFDTSNANATPEDILRNKSAYVNGKRVVGVIDTKTRDDIDVNGNTVNVPAGYYASGAYKSVEFGGVDHSMHVYADGEIVMKIYKTEGYIRGGTETRKEQLPTQGAATITPTKSSQTAVAKGVYTTGDVTVAPIPDQYTDASVTTIPYPYYVAAGEVYVDANGITQTGGLQTDHVVITHDDGSNHVNAQLTHGNASDYGFMYIDGDELGNALPQHVLEGHTFTGANGACIKESGTMPNNGDTSQTIDGLETKSVTIPEGYTTGGTVTVDDTVDNIADTQANLLEQIQSAIDSKSVPGGGSSNGNAETCTVTITRSGDLHIGTQYERLLGDVYYTTIENGAVVAKCENVGAGKIITCICNSLIAIDEGDYRIKDTYSGMTRILSNDGDNFAFDQSNIRIFLVTASPNENATLDVELE